MRAREVVSEAAATAAGGAMAALGMVGLIGLLAFAAWLGFTLWVGLSKGDPATNQYGPPPVSAGTAATI